MEEKICEVACGAIRVSPFQPRRKFSDHELEELAASIKAVGLIHPPVVREIKSGSKLLYYELIAGERRWRACQRIPLEKISVIVRESSDEKAAKATLIENVQRVDLDPLETAHAFKKLMDVFRMTQEEIAEKVGKKRSTVANYLRLLTLPPEIKNGLSEGSISMGHAKAILSLQDTQLQKELNKRIVDKQLTVREAEKESHTFTTKKKKTPKKTDLEMQNIQRLLEEHLGTKVQLESQKNGSGRLIVHFYAQDDLERLMGILNVHTDTH